MDINMKNPRLVEALKEMDEARELSYVSTRSAWSAWSASRSAWSAYWSAETNRKEVLKILKEKLNEKSKIS